MTEHATTSPDRRQRRRVLRWLLQGSILIGVYLALHAWQTRGLASGPAPEFQGRLLDGNQVSLSQFRGRPVLLQFWATWCPVCKLELAGIDRIAQDHAVLSVALDDGTDDALRQWMTNRSVAFPVVPDPAGEIAARFGVRGVPTSLVIDAAGRIRFVEVGYTTETGLRLRLWWVGL
ncbi:MAG: protein disulfide oxidoreductase [Thiogranum sp.]|nr:protein disulfide oxidoreductase [Thiogranum sp.]